MSRNVFEAVFFQLHLPSKNPHYCGGHSGKDPTVTVAGQFLTFTEFHGRTPIFTSQI